MQIKLQCREKKNVLLFKSGRKHIFFQEKLNHIKKYHWPFLLLPHSEERGGGGEEGEKIFEKWIILPFNFCGLVSSSWRPQWTFCYLLDDKIAATAWRRMTM